MNLDQFWAGVQSILNSLNIEMSNQELLTCLGIGIAAGWLASQIVGGKAGIIRYLVAGLLGAFLGPIVLGWIGIEPAFGFPLVNDVIVSTAGAIVIVLVARIIG